MVEFTKEELLIIHKKLTEKLSRKNLNRFSGKEAGLMFAIHIVISDILDNSYNIYPYRTEDYKAKYMLKIANLQPAERAITPCEAIKEIAKRDAKITELQLKLAQCVETVGKAKDRIKDLAAFA